MAFGSGVIPEDGETALNIPLRKHKRKGAECNWNISLLSVVGEI